MPYQVPLRIRINRIVLVVIFRLLFHILGRIRITGKENVPKAGAYVIAMNHVSIYDPPLIVAFWPELPEVVGAVEVWSKPGQSTLARLYGGIPIHRREFDRESLVKVISALRAGRPLVIAPEGTRSHQPGLQAGQAGIAYIIEKCPAPVVPVGIVGTTENFLDLALHFKRPKLEIRIGKQIHLEVAGDTRLERRATRQRNVDLIMRQIAALLPDAYQGIYAPIPSEEEL
jgi:1-acyl-sn-glycerol-3-phosphate acyltransferase